MLLPCGHLCCLVCLDGVTKKKLKKEEGKEMVRCPVCSKECEKIFVMEHSKMMEVKPKKEKEDVLMCVGCPENNVVTMYCCDCKEDQFLCSGCCEDIHQL